MGSSNDNGGFADLIAADPVAAAAAAGLHYVNDAIPGITRERRGGCWVYRRPDGAEIADPGERARIDAIGIPPAWTHVWISPLPDGHIQATGRDSRGRKQYRYHPRWREVRDVTKYHRMADFGRSLPGLRRHIDADLDLPGLPREKVLGAVIRLMDETLIRIGNEEYARQNHSYGLTTLHHEHVRIEGWTTIQFEFRAKSGKQQRVRLSDPRLASVVHACHELPGQELFHYIDDDGRVVHVGSADVNDYLRAITRAIVTAKDFRTWGGSVTAAETLVELGPPRSAADAKTKIVAAIDAAAARLNNTRAVCRKSYVNPRVPESYVDGTLDDAFRVAAERDRLRHSEAAMLMLVAEEPEFAEHLS
ncbi:DNA topoisomerase IB [Pseudonocardia acidicola]|uniref:DNA topoisomerase n=1 Tax=Pseudonocardia acidicola TaxID=2724939 RepID=A0ABX1SAC8_9PSEU|nr:DNA topoisomerase IB [Pseudonocardia acidicola]NMH97428.1 DNA topoisomerase IB [Pseudonocardia acidicola]